MLLLLLFCFEPLILYLLFLPSIQPSPPPSQFDPSLLYTIPRICRIFAIFGNRSLKSGNFKESKVGLFSPQLHRSST
ncbi:unnamed protein product [Microthlaspi erraticum]|uniref:Secreted protein n=1 Tax=Microthlaspi erraticum TaxID=1685480 RepID=A0A6D2KYA4_9BRAS|nr:unnamed protein product [Microthlaspi erraticum]